MPAVPILFQHDDQKWLTKSDTFCPNSRCKLYGRPKKSTEFRARGTCTTCNLAHCHAECPECGYNYYVEICGVR